MAFGVKTVHEVSRPLYLLVLIIYCFSIVAYVTISAAQSDDGRKLVNVGAIIDENSRIGREEKIALAIAVEDFNNISKNHRLQLYIENPGSNSLQVASTAKRLIEDKKVQVITGMHTWLHTALVADVGNQAQVPILSLATPAITPPSAAARWPFLIRMAKNDSELISCMAAMVESYGWRRIIVAYEDDAYGNDSGMLALLSEALHNVGSDIEYHIALPPFASLVDPKEIVREELKQVLIKRSRVFIVLDTSLPMVIHLFREAKAMGLGGRDSTWIITDRIANFLDSFDTSVISAMEGALGIRTYYSENTRSYKDFSGQLKKAFRNFLEEDRFEPGIYALRAYDSIRAITQALERKTKNTSDSKVLLSNILSSNFDGLSGKISFEAGELHETPMLRIVNVTEKGYNGLAYWIPGGGFSKELGIDKTSEEENSVNWSGGLDRVPKGWTVQTNATPLSIAVPGRTSYGKCVKFVSKENCSGFCIEIFEKICKRLGYALPYNLTAFYGSYDALVSLVTNKTYDAAVGDFTILANRSKLVEFTLPFAESGLSLIVPMDSRESAWMFMKPFSWGMWTLTVAILFYTMLVVWFLEHRSNPDFGGSWKEQLGIAISFTLSSMFFAHRERIYTNFTRVVIAVWLFFVFVLTSSYTASLSSILTVQQLDPRRTDIELLRRSNLKVGCDGDSFIRNYLVNVLHFNHENIVSINSSDFNHGREFESGGIAAAFLEHPYAKLFLDKNGEKYTVADTTYRFGGLGFIFQKGSPIVAEFSEAILELSENGALTELQEKYFATSKEIKTQRLSLKSFWGLYAISGATSTICFILFLIRLLKKYRSGQAASEGNVTPNNRSVWKKTMELAKYLYNGDVNIQGRSPPIDQGPDVGDLSSSAPDNPSPCETPNTDRGPDVGDLSSSAPDTPSPWETSNIVI